MDDQITNRVRSGNSILWWFALTVLLVGGAASSPIAVRGYLAAAKNYNELLVLGTLMETIGFVVGIGYGVVLSYVVRKHNIKFTRYTIRDMLLLLTIVAIALGVALNILNKK